MNRDIAFLKHISEAIDEIFQFTNDGQKAFFDSKLIQKAVIRNLEIIGEATTNISSRLRDKYPDVPWKKMIANRNRLIHEYFAIRLNITWKAIEVELPPLKKKMEIILNDLEH